MLVSFSLPVACKYQHCYNEKPFMNAKELDSHDIRDDGSEYVDYLGSKVEGLGAVKKYLRALVNYYQSNIVDGCYFVLVDHSEMVSDCSMGCRRIRLVATPT
jgi:hypothetical protein